MILLDGPMGTELEARGVPTPAPGWSAYAIETHPSIVRAIHADYAAAGARVHRTNTFRTQPRVFPDRWRSLLAKATLLAREGAPAGRVAGSMAPVADCYRPDLSPPDARVTHSLMARAFAEEGVDLLVCETFPHPGEARTAVEEAVRTGIETWIAFTAGPDGSLMSPEAMERAARDCASAGARAVLVCCTGAPLTRRYLERLANLGIPFGAYANTLGLALGPDDYAELAREWLALGATIVGGCCGTNPAHIARLVR